MQKTQIKWDVTVVIMQDGNQESMIKMEESLNEGFEPFAVVPMMGMPTNKDKIAQIQPKPVLMERVWLRRPVAVPVVESSSEVK